MNRVTIIDYRKAGKKQVMEVKSLFFTMSGLKCLIDIQVEMTSRQIGI